MFKLKLQIALCAAFFGVSMVSLALTALKPPQLATAIAATAVLTAPPEFPLPSELPAPEPSFYAYPAGGLSIDTADREAVRVFYNGLYSQSNNVAINWTGSQTGCNAGTTDPLYQAAVALRVNWFRAMAGVPATVSLYGPYSLQDQQAALVMSANNTLSHTPPSTWNCWNQTAYDAAGKSNLALGYSGADAVTGYILDNGSNNAPVGHRRWVLYPQTQNMGTGDVSTGTFNSASAYAANALWTLDSHTYDTRPAVRDDFVAWPPKGYVPYPVVYGRWSFAHSDADFANAAVAVTKGGVNIPVSIEALRNGYGENTLVWLLQGTIDSTVWSRPSADETYTVTVSNVVLGGATRSFTYNVTIFDPDTPTQNAPKTIVTPPQSASVSNAFALSLAPMPNASAYEIALYRLTAMGAISPATMPSPWSYVTGPGSVYNPVEASSFHLYHSDFANQTLTLNKKLYLAANANLAFDSRFTWATSAQIAHVQISLDDGISWQDVFTQAGANSVSQTTKTVDLSGFAGRFAMLRFTFTYLNGMNAYYQTDSGWYFNNINLTNISELQDGQTQTLAATLTGASFTAGAVSNYASAARTEYQGSYFGDWGPVSVFTVSPGTPTTTTSSTTTTAAPTTTTTSTTTAPTTTTSTSTSTASSTTTTATSTTTTTLPTQTLPLNLVPGWNLLGNSLLQPIQVATTFDDVTQVFTVWKWDAKEIGWQFYTPSKDPAALKTYADSKGYGVLSVINPGEGYWVNAKVETNLGSSIGTGFNLAAQHLLVGWNLVATGRDVSPSDLNQLLSAMPPQPGEIPISLTSLWAWNSIDSKWYFYAPTLEADGTLGTYTADKGYSDFFTTGKTLGKGIGFWVNKP